MKAAKQPQIVAHRGLSASYPENTLIAFEKALELPIDGLEFDLHPTRDGKVVVAHDHTLERCSTGCGAIRDHTLAELKALDFGSWKAAEFCGTRIPEFWELLDLVEERRPELFLGVELKEDDAAYARLVLEELDRRDRLGRCAIISFKPAMLRLAREFDPAIRLHGFVPGGLSAEEEAAHYQMLYRIGTPYVRLTSEFVQKYQALGLHVDVWGVEDEESWMCACAYGVNYVTTDTADVITQLRK